MKTAAVILAAGRGSRMLSATSDKPKCLVELGGKPLLQWQLEALHAAGIENILVVTGYKGEAITGKFQTAQNPRWAETNMLSSLLCADNFASSFFAGGEGKLIVSYSDIAYHPDHLTALLASPGEIAITYDTEWKSLWKLRSDNPLADAETFLQKDGLLVEIGERAPTLAAIHGQYMGLLAFTSQGWQNMLSVCARLGTQTDRTDMTSFLRLLLKNGIAVSAVPVKGRWCESDNETDLQKYEQALASCGWSHDWRWEK